MKVLLINPFDQTITERQIETGLKNIYAILDCEMIEAPMRYDNDDCMYCDEEAWLNVGNDKLAGFSFPDWNYAILGKAIIVGSTIEGEDADCVSTVADFGGVIWKADHAMRAQGEDMGMI